MSAEQAIDLTQLGSGKHEPITGFPHAEMPLLSPNNQLEVWLTIGRAGENRVIMQYLQPRTESKPIVDTTERDEKGNTRFEKILASNI